MTATSARAMDTQTFQKVKASLLDSSNKTPVVKHFADDWIRSLDQRGEPTVYTRANSQNFEYIGMPIGGICAGQLYLGGDGKLWCWDIFNTIYGHDNLRHVRAHEDPYERSNAAIPGQEHPAQGFAIRIAGTGAPTIRTLDRCGFENIAFRGQYPIGEVTYEDKAAAVRVDLEAFSPFVPLDLDASTYPATLMTFTITNTSSSKTVRGELVGWLENAVHIRSRHSLTGKLVNTIARSDDSTMLQCTAEDPNAELTAEQLRDDGSMALTLVGDPATARGLTTCTPPDDVLETDPKPASIPMRANAEQRLVGALGRTFELKPGQKATARFVLTWYFPHLDRVPIRTVKGRSYGARFDSAADVARHIVRDYDKLTRETRLWRDTWYDATLPWWLLDRTFLNTSSLATSTCHLMTDGRFYGWEGVYSCNGTCTHVWAYAQAVGRLFPELERRLREMRDYKPGIGFDPKTGAIANRAGYRFEAAVDGQSGCILKTYLVHEMQTDDAFLRRVYPRMKQAMDHLTRVYDADEDGILTGPQSNTLDAAWYGKIPWLSLYYDTALEAAARMADDMGDAAYAKHCRTLADRGRRYIETKLFNGEYFFQEADPEHPKSPGTYDGIEYSQLLGQSWAYHMGLGQVIDPAKATTYLESLWKYNVTTDVGPYREQYKAGRWFAMPGEGGIIACTWPRGGDEVMKHGDPRFSGYLNECQPGYEWATISLYMWHGEPYRALALSRLLDERYDARKHNPFNEVECGSHYSRSMASYGVFSAACGFDYHGPRQYIAFSPRVTPEDFKAAFVAAEGWGSFTQKRTDKSQAETLEVKLGRLTVRTLEFDLPAGAKASGVKVQLAGKPIPARFTQAGPRVTITLKAPATIEADQALTIDITR